MTTTDIEPVFAFLTKLTPFRREKGDWLALDERHRLGVTGKDNGDVTFLYLALIGDDWVLQSTITIDPGRKFWARVVQVVKAFATQMGLIQPFTLNNEEVAHATLTGLKLPNASHLTQERARGTESALPRKRTASLPELGVRVVKSKRKTVTRDVQDDEPDILDQ